MAHEATLSIDTYHAATAARCIELGAGIVNDVSAMRADPDMAAVIRDLRPVLVLMHAKDGPLPHATDRPAHYVDLVRDVADWLSARVDAALAAGIAADQIVLDPGWGKFRSLEPAHSWELLARFDELVERLAVPDRGRHLAQGALRRAAGRARSAVAVDQPRGPAKGAALIRTHHVQMAAQFVDAAQRMRLALPARATYA